MALFKEVIHGGVNEGTVYKGVHSVEGNRDGTAKHLGTARAGEPRPPLSPEGEKGERLLESWADRCPKEGPAKPEPAPNPRNGHPVALSSRPLPFPVGASRRPNPTGSQRTTTPSAPSAAGEVSFPPPRAKSWRSGGK